MKLTKEQKDLEDLLIEEALVRKSILATLEKEKTK